jgi:hypothetical protein
MSCLKVLSGIAMDEVGRIQGNPQSISQPKFRTASPDMQRATKQLGRPEMLLKSEVIVRAFHVDSLELQVLEMIFETN